jgi:hypothetical protein
MVGFGSRQLGPLRFGLVWWRRLVRPHWCGPADRDWLDAVRRGWFDPVEFGWFDEGRGVGFGSWQRGGL